VPHLDWRQGKGTICNWRSYIVEPPTNHGQMDRLGYEFCDFGDKLDGKVKKGMHGAAVVVDAQPAIDGWVDIYGKQSVTSAPSPKLSKLRRIFQSIPLTEIHHNHRYELRAACEIAASWPEWNESALAECLRS
jgi:hypothetical protein